MNSLLHHTHTAVILELRSVVCGRLENDEFCGKREGNIKQIPFGDCVLPKEEEEEKQEIIILSHFLFATLTLLPHM